MTDLNTQLAELAQCDDAKSPQLPSVFEAANLEHLYKQVEDEVKAEVPDVDTKEGRARIKSLAAKVSSSKTAIDKPIRDHLRALKAIPKVLEKNAMESIERFNALRATIIEPLESAQFEQMQKLVSLSAIIDGCRDTSSATSQDIKRGLIEAESVDIESFWPELKKKAVDAKESAITISKLTFERLEKEEAQAAELERLRKEAAEREQRERDRKIAEEAAEMARTLEVERARMEREVIERRAVEARQREEAQRMAAEQAMRDAEQAEQRRAEAEERAKREAIEAEERAKVQAQKAAEQAVEAERARIKEEAENAERLAKQREEDKEHRIKVNRAALVAIIAEGISEEDGKKVITAIAKNMVPNVKIFY